LISVFPERIAMNHSSSPPPREPQIIRVRETTPGRYNSFENSSRHGLDNLNCTEVDLKCIYYPKDIITN